MMSQKLRVGLVWLFVLLGSGAHTPVTVVAEDGTETASPTPIREQFDGEYGPFLPTLASERGAHIDRLINIVHIFMLAIFVPWFVFFVYCLVKFRARPGHRASAELPKAKISKYAEVGVAVVEVVLLLGFSMPIWAAVKNPDEASKKDAVHIRCISQQFQWNFHYPGPDGIFGRTDPTLVNDASNPIGIDRTDPNATDDFYTVGEFYFPVNKTVWVDLTSKDVIHSFALPNLRVKQDAIPGMSIPVVFDANKTGKYLVACAQLCGNNHFKMFGKMYVQTQEDYDAWLSKMAEGPEEFDD